MQRVTPLKADRHDQTPLALLEGWRRFLQEHDHSPGTVKKYTQAVAHFMSWYEQEERMPLQLAALTPIALIGYRNELQHEQHKSISTINLRISALRVWCAWLVDQGYLPLDPAARVKLVAEPLAPNARDSHPHRSTRYSARRRPPATRRAITPLCRSYPDNHAS